MDDDSTQASTQDTENFKKWQAKLNQTFPDRPHFHQYLWCSQPKTQKEAQILTNFLVECVFYHALHRDLVFAIASHCLTDFAWLLRSKNVDLGPGNRIASLNNAPSGSVLLNKKLTTGKYRFCIHAHNMTSVGCRYIGVINTSEIDYNTNLQYAAKRARCTLDGSCAKIYFDIPTKPVQEHPKHGSPGLNWGTGDHVEVEVDCDEGQISFYKNGKFVIVCNTKGMNQLWYPVVGFGYTIGQKVEICYFEQL